MASDKQLAGGDVADPVTRLIAIDPASGRVAVAVGPRLSVVDVK